MANVQAALCLMPVPLAATHQTGSVALLSVVLHVLLALRRPSTAAGTRRQANLAREAAAKANRGFVFSDTFHCHIVYHHLLGCHFRLHIRNIYNY
ncbi:hypothetical protein EDB85DRAFT_1965529 [Lactarius pseudohatsudake]|nr:hypothetical protein EDB85DRAFT_1965529 [Lactarius pseudohatsudake]